MSRKTVQVQVESEFESSVSKICRGVEGILGDVHVHLVADPRLNPARLIQVMTGKPRLKPLRWSELSDSQRKKLEDFIPLIGAEDYVKYGDTVLCTCPKAEWEAEVQRKARKAHDAFSPKNEAAKFARETGMPVDTQWEDVPDKFKAPS